MEQNYLLEGKDLNGDYNMFIEARLSKICHRAENSRIGAENQNEFYSNFNKVLEQVKQNRPELVKPLLDIEAAATGQELVMAETGYIMGMKDTIKLVFSALLDKE